MDCYVCELEHDTGFICKDPISNSTTCLYTYTYAPIWDYCLFTIGGYIFIFCSFVNLVFILRGLWLFRKKSHDLLRKSVIIRGDNRGLMKAVFCTRSTFSHSFFCQIAMLIASMSRAFVFLTGNRIYVYESIYI